MPRIASDAVNMPGLLTARPETRSAAGQAGLQRLKVRKRREALLYVPEGATEQESPLVLLLHGAGGTAQGGLDLLMKYADSSRLILLAPQSAGVSWDIISSSEYGKDISYLDECLESVFAHFAIAQDRLAIGGFSDGASYALSVGISNGDLFSHILAFSPGFMAPVRMKGAPKIFLSHGTEDTVLPIDACGRRLARVLQQEQLPVTYEEFTGAHTVPDFVRQLAVGFLLGAGAVNGPHERSNPGGTP